MCAHTSCSSSSSSSSFISIVCFNKKEDLHSPSHRVNTVQGDEERRRIGIYEGSPKSIPSIPRQIVLHCETFWILGGGGLVTRGGIDQQQQQQEQWWWWWIWQMTSLLLFSAAVVVGHPLLLLLLFFFSSSFTTLVRPSVRPSVRSVGNEPKSVLSLFHYYYSLLRQKKKKRENRRRIRSWQENSRSP